MEDPYANQHRSSVLGLALLDKKSSPIEKYQYLSVLRNTNVHLFYRLLANNIKVRRATAAPDKLAT